MILLPEEESLVHFRRALRRSDQMILDDLLAAIQKYQPAALLASQALPVENLLLALLIEEHKEVARLRYQVNALQAQQNGLLALNDE